MAALVLPVRGERTFGGRRVRKGHIADDRPYLVPWEGRTGRRTTTATSASRRVDRKEPSTPTELVVAAATTTTAALAWSPAKDNVGVVGYDVLLDGALVGRTEIPGFTLANLSCNETYTAAVQAFDRVGNRSALATIQFATAPCPDAEAPTAPSQILLAQRSESSISITWLISTDNVGVVEYATYRDGTAVGKTSAPSYTFSGLSCNRNYTIAVDAVDGAGNRSAKATVMLATAACSDATPPTAPTGLTVVSTGQTSLTVGWQPSTDNRGVSGYEVSVAGTVAGRTTATSYEATGLTCATTYAVTVRAFDGAGNLSVPATVQGATAACASPSPSPPPPPPRPSSDTEAPSVPDNQRITETTTGTMTMAWDPSTDNVGVAGYHVLLDGALIATTTATSYTYTGLKCGTTYDVALTAFDNAGNETDPKFARGPETTAACPSAGDTEAPTAPTGLTKVSASQTAIDLSWNASTDNVGVTGYGLHRDGNAAGTSSTTSGTVGGLACGTTYALAVDAYDAAGNRSGKTTLSAATAACSSPTDTTPPTTPGSIAASAATATSVTVSWSASTDNVGVQGYGVYAGATLVGTTSSTSYVVSGLTCGATVTVGVDAFDAAGNRSGKASVVAATTPCSDTQPPTTPTGLRQSVTNETSVTVTWTASTDNVGVVAYGLYLNGVQVATTPGTSAALPGLTCGTNYTVNVDAVDAAGNRSAKAALIATTDVCPTLPADTTPPSVPNNQRITGVTSSTIAMAWDPSTDNVGVAGYHVLLDGARVATTTSTAYTYVGLKCGTTYVVAVTAFDTAGNETDPKFAQGPVATGACTPTGDTQAPTTPTALTRVSASQTAINLSWNASTDNVGVTGYGLYRDGSSAGSTSTTSGSVSSLACGTSYTLAVDAYDAAGNRSGKATLSASTDACATPPSSGATLYLSPSGSDSNPCSQAAPCRSFNRAYGLAQVGQVVELAGGSYGSQGLSGSKSGTGAVTFRPAAGASVAVGSLSLNGQTNLEFRDMKLDDWYIKYAKNVTFRNVDTRFFFVRSSDQIAILGGSVGPIQDGTSPTIGNFAGSPVSTNVTVDGVYFHDIGRQNAPGAHVECLFLQEAANVVIRNSKFTRCDIMDLYVSPVQGGPTAYNVTIENNWFDEPTGGGYYALDIHPDAGTVPRNFIVRYNSFNGSILVYEGFNYDNVQFVGNIGRVAYCGQPGIRYAYNVWSNQKCSSTDKLAAAGFLNVGGFDLHLAAGSAAIDAGDSSSYPSTDIDGDSRPRGAAPDAGADER